MDNAEREENLNNFKNGNLNVLVSCTALDEGFDMPEADGAMILSASSSKRQRIQRLGRTIRVSKDKSHTPTIYTLFSTNSEYNDLKQEEITSDINVKWGKI